MVDIPHHPCLCQESSLHRNQSSPHPTQLNANWFYFLIFDLVTVLLFARCLSKSYESIVRIKKQVMITIFSLQFGWCPSLLPHENILFVPLQRKSEVDLPRLSVIALAATQAKNDPSASSIPPTVKLNDGQSVQLYLLTWRGYSFTVLSSPRCTSKFSMTSYEHNYIQNIPYNCKSPLAIYLVLQKLFIFVFFVFFVTFFTYFL